MYIPEYVTLTIGYTSIILLIICRLPQIYQLYKTKHGTDISIPMTVMLQLSAGLAIIYGIFRNDYIYIIGSSFSFFQNLLILYLIKRYEVIVV